MEQPQPCTKCKKLPEDILMLACGHDLCLDCASERLAFEMKKKKPANCIVCEICYEKTALDSESVQQLQKLIPSTHSTQVPLRSYADTRPPYDRVQRVVARSGQFQQKTKQKGYERQPVRGDYAYNSQVSSTSTNNLTSGISSKKSCSDHPEQQILYYCFDCKCECICPECVIHGKHKDHDVKTIKKSAPVVKTELEKGLDKIESAIEGLLIRKSEAEKSIRTVNEQSALSKRQVQSAFEEVRAKLSAKQKQILSSFDGEVGESIKELEKAIKGVVKRIEELRLSSAAVGEFMKKEDLLLLNFYAKRWKEISEESKEGVGSIPAVVAPSNERLLASILDIADGADRLTPGVEKRRAS